MSEEATVRGALFIGVRLWVTKTHGEQDLRELVSTLTEEERAIWDGRGIVNTSQHPARYFRNMGDAIVARWGRGDTKYLRGVGAFVAFNDLATYMKVLMKLGSPAFVASRFPRIWRHYFSHGTLRVVDEGDRRVTIALEGADMYGAIGSEGAAGWMRAAIEYSGGRNARVEAKQNLARGWLFDIEWK